MLDKIVNDKKEELKQVKKSQPLSALKERIAQREETLDFKGAITGGQVRLIAEVKQSSPSRGVLAPDFDPVALAGTYAESGAAAISVLTESNYFRGSLDHLEAIRGEVTIPLLRKDFIFEPYQVYESRACGADAILLIAAILNQSQLEELFMLSRQLGLESLVEVHDEGELERVLAIGAGIIGINNRDLKTFQIDTNTTGRLRSLIPTDRIVVSESGISGREGMTKLKRWGVNAVLVGEALITAGDIPAKMKELLS
ncbi:indole-3-glycerol phosphate synthase TrpC [Chloroflexota bacterium]